MKKNKDILKFYTYNALINFSLISNILSIYLEKVGFSLLNIGTFFAIMHIGKVVFEIPTGYIADVYGNKISMILALIVRLIAYILLYTIPTFVGIIVAFILLSVSYTLTTGCYDSLLIFTIDKADSDENITLANVNSVNRVIFYCSSGLASLCAGYLFEKNIKLLYMINIACVLGCIYVISSIGYEKKIEEKDISKATHLIVNHIVHNKVILYFILIEAGINFSMIPVDEFIVNYFHTTFDVAISKITTIQGLIMISVSLLAAYLNKKMRRLSKPFILRYGPIIMICTFLIFAYANNPYVAVSAYGIALLIFSIYAPHNYEFLHKNILDSYRTTIVSIKSLITMGIATISQPIFGYFGDKYSIQNSSKYLLLFSLIFILIVNIIFRDLDLGRKKE